MIALNVATADNTAETCMLLDYISKRLLFVL